jgi:hypothetical protein
VVGGGEQTLSMRGVICGDGGCFIQGESGSAYLIVKARGIMFDMVDL